jgi:hypothetical protein
MPPKTKKSTLGQFFTTNYEYILTGFVQPPSECIVIEPFAGNADILKFLVDANTRQVEAYDIDPKHEWIIGRDTILDPPDYTGKYVITNPPYLARNKSVDKTAYDKYATNDLYKCFIETLILSQAIGGVMIIPLNFMSSIRASDVSLRKRFLEKYHITRINIFEEQVFDDTSYSVCSLQFIYGNSGEDIQCFIFPSNRELPKFKLEHANNYSIGGEIYNLSVNPAYKIDRATRMTKNTECITNIVAKCLDDSADRRIALSIVKDEDRIIDETEDLTARSYATLVIEPALSMEEQVSLVQRFNVYLNAEREKYNSLFLTNYRESNTIARKRISFGLVFQICGNLLTRE